MCRSRSDGQGTPDKKIKSNFRRTILSRGGSTGQGIVVSESTTGQLERNAWSRVVLPSWLGSILFHLIVLGIVLLYLWLQPIPPSAPGVRNALGSIVMKSDSEEGRSYIDSINDQSDDASPYEGAEQMQAPVLADVFGGEFSEINDLSEILPNPAIGPRSRGGAAQQIASAANLANDFKKGGRKGGIGSGFGGKVSVSVFGAEGNANSFVYVFDQSGSMDEYGGRPMRVAKAELIRSLEPLGSLQQFNIIFYNEKPYPWKIGKMIFANDINKSGAIKYVEGVIPRGGTRHFDALVEALRLSPEVIFFLTDGDENDALKPGQLEALTKRNERSPGAQINVIQFGSGPGGQSHFLRKLAAQNRGQYMYVDILQMSNIVN